MGLSFADLRAEVVTNTGRTDRLDYINKQINKGIEYFNRLWPFKGLRQTTLISVVANDQSFSLPSDFLWIQQVLLLNGANSYQVDVRGKSFMLQRWPNARSTAFGLPAIGYIDGSLFYFVPVANQAYQFSVSYYRKMPLLVTDSDTILIDYLDEAVVAYATAKVFKSVEQFDSAQVWLQDAQGEFLAAKDADARAMGQMDVLQGTGSQSGSATDPQNNPFVFNDPTTSDSGGW
jgi:hypothetical protein